MELILISAMSRSRVIGNRNRLPWNLPDEYEHFRGLVRGHPVIMGRTTYEIFGPDLHDSPLIVVSTSRNELPDAQIHASVESALEAARALPGDRVFSAGGASIYRQTLPLADALYLSIIDGDYEGDTWFPAFDERDWPLVRTDQHPHWNFTVRRKRGSHLESSHSCKS